MIWYTNALSWTSLDMMHSDWVTELAYSTQRTKITPALPGAQETWHSAVPWARSHCSQKDTLKLGTNATCTSNCNQPTRSWAELKWYYTLPNGYLKFHNTSGKLISTHSSSKFIHAEGSLLVFRHCKVLSEENEGGFHTDDINNIEGLQGAQVNTACRYFSLSSIPAVLQNITNPCDVALILNV